MTEGQLLADEAVFVCNLVRARRQLQLSATFSTISKHHQVPHDQSLPSPGIYIQHVGTI
jgi:hypothetical protein